MKKITLTLLMFLIALQTFAWNRVEARMDKTADGAFELVVKYQREEVAKINVFASNALVIPPERGVDFPADLMGEPRFSHVLILDEKYRVPLRFEVEGWEVIWKLDENNHYRINGAQSVELVGEKVFAKIKAWGVLKTIELSSNYVR